MIHHEEKQTKPELTYKKQKKLLKCLLNGQVKNPYVNSNFKKKSHLAIIGYRYVTRNTVIVYSVPERSCI